MKILPSWKEKRRYLLILVGDKEKVKKEIKDALIFLIGAIDYAKARPFFVANKSKYLILSINRKYLSQARASLLLCKSKPRCIFVSGTLKKLKNRIKELEKQKG